ncbi:MAG TPA: hypothetical protein VF518_03040, partial [Polyangia bacterium]
MRFHRTIELLVLLIGLAPTVSLAAPDWVAGNGKSARFPTVTHLSGYGLAMRSGEKDQATCLQMALDRARGDLAQKITFTIRSELVTSATESNKNYSSYVSNVTRVVSGISLEGVEREQFFDEKAGICYGLVWAPRDRLGATYAARANILAKQIVYLVNQARLAADKQTAIDLYARTLPIFRTLEEARVIAAVALGRGSLPGDVDRDNLSLEGVKRAIAAKLEHPVRDLADAAWYLAYLLRDRKAVREGVRLAPFTYQDTPMNSPFSRYLQQQLVQKLTDTAGFTIVEPSGTSKPAFALSGTYWEQPDGVRVIATLREVGSGKAVAASEIVIPAAVMKASGLATTPQNFRRAYADMKAFAENEVVGGGLAVEVFTSRGDNPIVSQGDTVKLSVRVSQPAYIRILYHLADGHRALLVDNHYVDASKVNKVYELPDEFECAAPFGA